MGMDSSSVQHGSIFSISRDDLLVSRTVNIGEIIALQNDFLRKILNSFKGFSLSHHLPSLSPRILAQSENQN